jgi:hypothetical protein
MMLYNKLIFIKQFFIIRREIYEKLYNIFCVIFGKFYLVFSLIDI